MSSPHEKLHKAEEDEVKPPDGIIRFEVDNVSTLNKNGRYSPYIDAKGVPWRAFVMKNNWKNGEDRLQIYLYSIDDTQSMLWSIDADVEFTLVHSDGSKSLRENRSFTLNASLCCCFHYFNDNTTGKLLKWSDLIDDKKGFINDDKITVEIRFWITEMTGLRGCPLRVDFSDPCELCHDVALVIEGEKVYVGRQILAIYSPVFYSMFYSNFAEKNKKEIELKDIDREEFIELLNQIYPSRKEITDDNVMSLLTLADRFHIQIIIDKVERFLIESSRLDLLVKMELSQHYRLIKLQKENHFEIETTGEANESPCSFDFLDSHDPRHDVEVVIGEVKIYASKQYLSLHSAVFAQMLSDKTKINISADREEFLEMLRVIYPSCGKITDDNLNALLKMADRFQIKLLFDLAEDYLISKPTIDIPSVLLISDQYKLIKLQDHCLYQLETIEEVKELEKPPEYNQLSDKTKVSLLHKIFQLMED